MTAVTICVPAYRSAAFIAQTLASARVQTFDDYIVEVAVEPDGADETELACRPFLADGRFHLRRNERPHGWSGNVGALLGRVTTPYFVVLPNDDIWHPRYLATLMARLVPRPDASVAFGDIFLFGAASGIRTYSLPDGELAPRLLGFFLAGADAHPWRGLTRSEVLDRPFPTNDFDGFAVECEWTVHLLRCGVALRVPEPMYLKRQRSDADSVSVGWLTVMPEGQLRAALEHHRRQLLAAILDSPLSATERRPIELAAEAAMLQRWVLFNRGRFAFGDDQHRRAHDLLRACRGDPSDTNRRILARTLLALGRYEGNRDDHETAHRLLSEAAIAAPTDWEVAAALAWSHLRFGRPIDALALVYRAARLAPMALGLRQLEAACARAVDENHDIRDASDGSIDA